MGIKVLILEIDGAASDTELSLRTGRPGNGIIVRHHVASVKFEKVGIVILISFSTAVQLCSGQVSCCCCQGRNEKDTDRLTDK